MQQPSVGDPGGNAQVSQESGVVPTDGVMPRRECPECTYERISVRLRQLPDASTREMCAVCARERRAKQMAPELPSVIEIAVARVELVEARHTHAEQLAAAVGAGGAPEGDLPYTWPDPEVVS